MGPEPEAGVAATVSTQSEHNLYALQQKTALGQGLFGFPLLSETVAFLEFPEAVAQVNLLAASERESDSLYPRRGLGRGCASRFKNHASPTGAANRARFNSGLRLSSQQRGPGLRTNDAVRNQPIVALELSQRGFGARTENTVGIDLQLALDLLYQIPSARRGAA